MADDDTKNVNPQSASDQQPAGHFSRRQTLGLFGGMGAAAVTGILLAKHVFREPDGRPLTEEEREKQMKALNAASEKAKELGVVITDAQLTEVVGSYVAELAQQNKQEKSR